LTRFIDKASLGHFDVPARNGDQQVGVSEGRWSALTGAHFILFVGCKVADSGA
jgi:hypothetical protein